MSSLDGWIGLSIPQGILDKASAWVALLDSDRCTLADRLTFASWLDEDARHRLAFEELSEVWAKLRVLKDVEPLLDKGNVVPFPGAHEPITTPVPLTIKTPARDWATAAALGLLCVGIALNIVTSPGSQRYSTDTGEARHVELADGSTLLLNSKSSVEVTLDATMRSARLLNGESVFQVTGEDRLFSVHTHYADMQTHGGLFAVETQGNYLEMTVLQGEVYVTTRLPQQALTEFDGLSPYSQNIRSKLVGEGEKLIVSGTDIQLSQTTPDELKNSLSWRDGYIVFVDKPLNLALKEMRRYSDVSIQLADKQLNDLRISGKFNAGDSQQLLSHLVEQHQVTIDASGQHWVTLRAPSKKKIPSE